MSALTIQFIRMQIEDLCSGAMDVLVTAGMVAEMSERETIAGLKQAMLKRADALRLRADAMQLEAKAFTDAIAALSAIDAKPDNPHLGAAGKGGA